jgi:hypothetical protein
MTNDELNNLLDAVASVLLRCFLLSFCLLLLWFFFYLAASDWMYSMHSRLFEVERHNFDMVCYYGMGFIKMVGFLFFLFPYVSIKLILRRR